MKRILTLTAVAAMVFTACSKEESTGTGDKQVRITPTIANPALTPAACRPVRVRRTPISS